MDYIVLIASCAISFIGGILVRHQMDIIRDNKRRRKEGIRPSLLALGMEDVNK